MCDGQMTASNHIELNRGERPCLFVSYQRPDKVIVEDILRRLRRNGFRVWWDTQISSGISWEESIRLALERSKAFLGFVSNGIFESEWSLFELKEAIRRQENDTDYTVVLVFLEKVPLSSFHDHKIQDAIKKYQYISFWECGGITEVFIKKLLSARWHSDIIEPEFREIVRMKSEEGTIETLEEFFKGIDVQPKSYHRLSNRPKKAPADGNRPSFFRLTPNDLTSRETVYPVILDNQWIPPAFYDKNNPKYHAVDKRLRDDFENKGLTSQDNDDLKSEIESMQRREFIRALLHNWQIVINRASIFNTTALRAWYQAGSPDYDAFRQLIGDDSIVVYLFGEDSPTDEPPFDYDRENYNAWKDFCLSCPDGKEVACVRFDWEKAGNDSEKVRLLTRRIETFFLTLAQDTELKNDLIATFGIADEDKALFDLCLRAIQQDVIDYSLVNDSTYNRERFYEAFLIKKKTADGKRVKVNDGILRTEGRYRKFVPMLKQLMDHIYVVNLPEALGIQPYFPPDSGLNPFLLDQRPSDLRVLTVNQLLCAVEEFDDSLNDDNDTDSILNSQMPWTDNSDAITLTMAEKLRRTDEWKSYLLALTDSKHRNRLSEVDFYNIHRIWQHYHKLMNLAEQEFPELGWTKHNGAVSIIYRFEALTVITVYTKGQRKMKLPPASNKPSGKQLARKMRLTIDYVCTDVLADGLVNPFQSEIRLFEGLTAGEETILKRTGDTDENDKAKYEQKKFNLYDALTDRLKELGFEDIDQPTGEIKEENHVQQ